MALSADIAVTVTLLLAAYLLYPQPPSADPPAFLLRSSVSHARLRPATATHAFTYPVLSLLVPLAGLEALRVGPRGLFFTYASRALLSLHAENYLDDDAGSEPSLPAKLARTLCRLGYRVAFAQGDAGHVPAEAWMLTMPEYLGYAGLNPLTVYFVYRNDTAALWLVVLEVHNTFSERHVYVLEIGVGEETRASEPEGWHTWMVPRTFHVSPFNDRTGTYTVSARAPPAAPSSMRDTTAGWRVGVTIALREDAPEPPSTRGPVKLTATLAATPTPLSARALLRALAAQPLVLLLTLPRILWEAGRLHYARGLRVWRRPEMRWRAEPVPGTGARGMGVAGQRATLLERAAERAVRRFLGRRARELGVRVVLATASEEPGAGEDSAVLTITHRSPRLFTLLALTPDPARALAVGGRRLVRQTGGAGDVAEFWTSDDALFCRVFGGAAQETAPARSSWAPRAVAWLLAHRPGAGDAGAATHPHPLLDAGRVRFVALVGALVALEWVEEAVWWVLKVKWEEE